MAIEMLYEKDGSLAPLQDKTIAVIGFGSQGHAHGLNARERPRPISTSSPPPWPPRASTCRSATANMPWAA